MRGGAGEQGACRRRGLGQPPRRVRVLLEGNLVRLRCSDRPAYRVHPVVYRTRQVEVQVDRVPDRAHFLLLHAAVVPGEQHAPLCEGNEHRVVHLELDGELDRPASVIVSNGLDVGLQGAQNGRVLVRFEPGGPEVRREAHLKHIGLFLRRTEGLCVRAAKGDARRVERVPHGGIGIAGPERLDVEAGNPCKVRERRHVHDGHAGDGGAGHRVQELAHPRRAVLGLLHREGDQIELRRVRFPGGGARQASREPARIDLHELVPPLHRHPYSLAFPVDELGFLGQADKGRGMARGAELDAEQRPVGGAHDHDVVHFLAPCGLRRVTRARRSDQSKVPLLSTDRAGAGPRFAGALRRPPPTR